MGSIMGSQKILGSDYGSNISVMYKNFALVDASGPTKRE
jgi:hypothetical protein